MGLGFSGFADGFDVATPSAKTGFEPRAQSVDFLGGQVPESPKTPKPNLIVLRPENPILRPKTLTLKQPKSVFAVLAGGFHFGILPGRVMPAAHTKKTTGSTQGACLCFGCRCLHGASMGAILHFCQASMTLCARRHGNTQQNKKRNTGSSLNRWIPKTLTPSRSAPEAICRKGCGLKLC